MEIPLCRPFFNTEEIEEISRVLASGWVSKGPECEKFEQALAHYVGVRGAVAVINCTAALHLALLSVEIKKGDEVLVADFTFPATGHAVKYCGADPVFVDVREDTYNIDPNKVEQLITSRTRAIIPVHTFGQPADMSEIMSIARDHNLIVIEDAACALGSTYEGKQIGSIGDLGCYSFHARKGITTGEGGMVVAQNEELVEKARYLSTFGMKAAWERENKDEFTVPEFHDLGYNYKMSDILAAVGVVQMCKLDGIIKRKNKLAQCWTQNLRQIESFTPPYVSSKVTHVFQSYVCVVDDKINRNKLIARLRNEGIQSQIGTYSSHVQPVYRSKQSCPVSKHLADHSIALPLYYDLTEEEIIDMVSRIGQIVEEIA